MKVELELNIDSNGKPCVKFKHHDKDNSLDQKILGVFVDAVKEDGCELKSFGPCMETGTSVHFTTHEIRIKDKIK